MKKISLLMGTLVFLLIFSTGCSKENSDPVYSNQPIEDNSTVEAFGVVKSTDIQNILIDFPARVSEINVINGQRVKKDDSLISLDLEEYQNQIKLKEIALNVEKLQLKKLEDTLKYNKVEYDKLIKRINSYKNSVENNSDPNIQGYLNKLEHAQVLYNKSIEEYNLKEELYNSGGISKSDLEEAKKQVNLNKANIDDLNYSIKIYKESRQQEIDKLQTEADEKFPQINSKDSDPYINMISQQKEKIDALEIELKQMKDKLNKSFIKDNYIVSNKDNALIDDITYKTGDFVSTSVKALSIINLDSMVVEANIPEEFISKVKLGAEATLIPDADKSKIIKGKVTSIANNAVTNNGETTVLARITFDDNENILLPGYNVNIKIETED